MRDRNHPRRHVAALLLTLTIVTVTAACNPVFGQTSGPVQHASLSSSQGLQYSYTGDSEQVHAHAGSPFGDSSVREMFWNDDRPYYADQQSCITWDTHAMGQPGEDLQPGLAMRIATVGADKQDLRAIIVTENIIFGAVWLFNVHIWDTRNTSSVFSLVGQFDLSELVIEIETDEHGDRHASLVDTPWFVCGRTDGDTFTFKVWTHQDAEPGWDDPAHVFTTTLPPGWDHAGYSGGYIGHLRANQSASFSGFTTSPLCLAPDMVDTPRCQALSGDET